MDQDITDAADQFTLEKIKAQDYRDALKAQRARGEAQAALQYGFFAWAQAEYAKLPVEDPAADLRLKLALAIADKYFTTSTAVDPIAVAADAQKDGARFSAALAEAEKIVRGA